MTDTWPLFEGYDAHFVHPRLAVGACPFPKDVPTIAAAGIRAIINAQSCLLREHIAYVCALPETIYWKMLGTWDGVYPNEAWDGLSGRPSAPTIVCPHYAEFMVEQAMPVIRDRSPVLIHCGGGIGRSGNLAAIAYAAMEGCSIDEALDRMREHRSKLAGWNPNRYPDTNADELIAQAREILEG